MWFFYTFIVRENLSNLSLFLILYLFHFSNVNQLSSVNEDDTVIDVPVDENCQLTDRHPDPDKRMPTMESWNPIPDTASKWHYSWLNNVAKRCQFEMISWNTGILFVMRRELGMHWRTHFSVSLVRKSIEKPNKTTEQKINWHNKTLEETLCMPPDWKCLNMCDRLNSRDSLLCRIGRMWIWSGPSQKATDLSLVTALESPLGDASGQLEPRGPNENPLYSTTSSSSF
jgi:hypothetical protein